VQCYPPDQHCNAATVRLRRVTPLLPVADGDLVLFAETEDGQVVGWLPGIPKLNEALIYAGGLRYPWNYLPTTRAPRSSPGISAR
jgi:hypothetical protein